MNRVDREAAIKELAEDINYDSANYEYPNSPGTLFMSILSRHSAIEDDAGIADTEMPDTTYSWLEMKHLSEWFAKMYELATDSESLQLLYDSILGQDEEENEEEDEEENEEEDED